MNKRKKKKVKEQVAKYEYNYNSLSLNQMIEIQAEAYYRAMKKIDLEKSEENITNYDKKTLKWYDFVLLVLNIMFVPWKINRKFRISDQIYDNILVLAVSIMLHGIGGVLWLIGLCTFVYDVYIVITNGVTLIYLVLFIIAILLLCFGSMFILAGDKFIQEVDSYKIYAYSASVIALMGVIISIVALFLRA